MKQETTPVFNQSIEMNPYPKPFFTHETEGNNFYVNKTFQVPYSVHIKEGAFTFKDNIKTPYTFESEQIPSVKLYISKENRFKVNQLSVGAKELFMWILFACPKTEDLYWLNRKRFMYECNVKSLTSYLKYVKQLTKANIIAPTGQTKDVFWINPNFFFRGDKLEKYKDYKVLFYSYDSLGTIGEKQKERTIKQEMVIDDNPDDI